MPDLWDSIDRAQAPQPAPDMWRAPMPDVGAPLVSPGPQVSQGTPWANALATYFTTPKPRDENSPVAFRTASPLVNITDQDIANATDLAMGFSGGGLGIKAYHGSPHDFEKFDLSKIGTGEGAQAYGHGLYFADQEATAKAYRDALAEKGLSTPESLAANALNTSGYGRQGGIDYYKNKLQRETFMPEQSRKDFEDAIKLMESGWESPKGHMYEVNINADPAHFLDLNSPQQSEHVRQAIEKYGLAPQSPDLGSFAGVPVVGAPRWADTAAEAARLNEAGIPGIKYLDQGSRNAPISSMGIKQLQGRLEQYKADLAGGFGDPERMKYNIASIERELASYKPTSNYVVFNDKLIDILRKYGIAGAAPLAAGFGFQPTGNEQRM